ncbi:MAG TPA: ECF-type sigma factor, partial [Bryobacteraceae bacterium]|nr:ECF-type sigma factor [Bryobacteraceae bacterium]
MSLARWTISQQRPYARFLEACYISASSAFTPKSRIHTRDYKRAGVFCGQIQGGYTRSQQESESVPEMGSPHSEQITGLLRAWSAGDQTALDRLFPILQRELKQIARRYMRRERKEHTLVMTLPFFGSSEDGALAWWSGSSEAT